MIDVLDYAPIAATTLAIPQFLPQIVRLRATEDAAGLSWAWALLTSLNNAAWIAYFALARYWSALVPATAATLLAGLLAVMLSRRGQAERRSAGLIAGWAALLAVAAAALRPGRPWRAADRGVRRPGRAVHLDRVPDGQAYRRLAGDVAAHPRRARLLAGLRRARVGPAADRPWRARGDREPAHAGQDLPARARGPRRARERPGRGSAPRVADLREVAHVGERRLVAGLQVHLERVEQHRFDIRLLARCRRAER